MQQSAVIPGDCRQTMAALPDGCASLIFTSPPYNVGFDWEVDGRPDGSLTWPEYFAFLQSVLDLCPRILAPGGSLVFNVPAGVGRTPEYIPIAAPLAVRMAALPSMVYAAEIVWEKTTDSAKGIARHGSCAWGSYMSPSSPCVRDVHEMLLVARKLGGPLAPAVEGSQPDISREEFMMAATSIWKIQSVSQEPGQRWFKGAFPVRLVERAIRFWTFPGDLVLDPFGGSGTTGVAAKGLDRRYLLCEVDPAVAARAAARIEHAGQQTALEWGTSRPVG